MPYPSGLVRNQVQCLDDYGIPLYLRHTIVDIRGKERVTGATIMQVDDKWRPIPGSERVFDVDTILFSVGLIPENELSEVAGCVIAGNGGPEINEYLETSVPGIFACGNVLQVHDLVDWVTAEADEAGKFAAMYAKGEITSESEDAGVKVIPGKNVGYVKPEKIQFLKEESVVIFSYRIRSPQKDIRTELVSGGKVIYTRKHRFALPSEMIIIKPKLKPEDIQGDITVNLIEKDVTVLEVEKEMMERE